MRTDYETFIELRKVKEKILSLDPFKDSALCLEHLIRNAIEILEYNEIELGEQFYISYDREISGLINSHVVNRRIEYFKNAQSLIRDVSEEDFSMPSIPKEWSTPLADRYDSQYKTENEDE